MPDTFAPVTVKLVGLFAPATPGSSLVVDDSSRGLSSAVAAGIDCAVVHHDFTATQDFSQASRRIESLRELKDIVLGRT